jgi:hypothetical protein
LSVESAAAASNPTTAQALSAFERPFTRAPSAEDFEDTIRYALEHLDAKLARN